jgi:O-antigen/teichoic acid export membrane protein
MYAFAVLTADQLKTLANVIYTVAGPKLAQHKLVDIMKTFWRKMWLMGAFGLFAYLAYVLVAPFVFKFLFPAYIGAVGYSQLYAITLIFSLPALLGSYLLNAQDLKKEANAYNVANQGLLIILLVFGGIIFGVWGIVAARVIGSVLQLAIIIWVLFKKKQSLQATAV